MRSIDKNKLIQVEKATIKLVVNQGYGGASVSSIAKEAGVSKGYLYRFYKNKETLVQTLLTRHVDVVIDAVLEELEKEQSTDRIIELMVDNIFLFAREAPDHIKFIHVLLHDYNFQLVDKQRNKIQKVCNQFYTIGTINKTVDPERTIEEIFFMIVVYPIEFINYRLKSLFGTTNYTDEDALEIKRFCKKTLRS